VAEIRDRGFDTLPFERVLLDLVDTARPVDRFQGINGRKPEQLAAALRGERVGTVVHR